MVASDKPTAGSRGQGGARVNVALKGSGERFDRARTVGANCRFRCHDPVDWIHSVPMYPDDTAKDLGTVLSYLAGRKLTKEQIWKAMELPRSTYYDQLDRGTLITADNLRRAAANLGINRAELLTRYRFIDPEEVKSLAEAISGQGSLLSPPSLSRCSTTRSSSRPHRQAPAGGR